MLEVIQLDYKIKELVAITKQLVSTNTIEQVVELLGVYNFPKVDKEEGIYLLFNIDLEEESELELELEIE